MKNTPSEPLHLSKDEDLEAFQVYQNSEKRVLVFMPFDSRSKRVWIAIKRTSKNANVACLRVDQIYTSTSILEDIIKCIHLADAVIVDISRANPNVLFELGLCYGYKKCIVIKNGKKPVPSNIRDLRYIPYSNSPEGIKALKKKLRKFIITAVGKPNILA